MLLFVSILCPHSGFSEVKVIKIILFRVTNVQQKCTKNRFLTVKEIKGIKSKKYLCINGITCVFLICYDFVLHHNILYFVGFYVLLLFDIVINIQYNDLAAVTATDETVVNYLQNAFFSAGYLMAASVVALKCLNLVPDLAAWMIPEGDTAFSTRSFGEGIATSMRQSASRVVGI